MIEDSVVAPGTKKQIRNDSSMPCMRVLVADDNARILDVVAALLKGLFDVVSLIDRRRDHTKSNLLRRLMPVDPENYRLEEARAAGMLLRKWGTYLRERQWGTVREDYSQDGKAWNDRTCGLQSMPRALRCA
jgi:hypothetical protein